MSIKEYRDSIIKYVFAEKLKTQIMQLMDILIRFSNWRKNNQVEPAGQDVLRWLSNGILNEIQLGINVTKSNLFKEAFEKIGMVIEGFNLDQDVDIDLLPSLRDALTRITTEASTSASKLSI